MSDPIAEARAKRPRRYLAVGYGFVTEADTKDAADAIVFASHVSTAPYPSAVYVRVDRASGLFGCPECGHAWRRDLPMPDDDISCPACAYRDEARHFWPDV